MNLEAIAATLAGLVLLGASVCVAATRERNAVQSAAPSSYISPITARLVPLLPDGARVRSIVLGCKPPPDAQLIEVAPGVSQLSSEGFVVEFQSGQRTLACSASLKAERQVLVAMREVSPQEPVSTNDFQLRWTDAFGAGVGALTALPGPGPFVAATEIRAGQPLLPTELARPVAIHPGDLVTVLVKNGPVSVRTRLEARASAAVGDSTTVINPESGMPITVLVTGDRTAELVMQ